MLQLNQDKVKSLALDVHMKEIYEENHTYKPNGDNKQKSIKTISNFSLKE